MQIRNIGENCQFSVLAADILTSFHLIIFMARLIFNSSADTSSDSSLNVTNEVSDGSWLILQLSRFYVWFRLSVIIITLLLHIYVALRILQNMAKKCTGCKLFANICAANCINLGIWTLIAVEESRVWVEDLGPKLCRIHLQGLHFWTTFIMVNIIIIGVLNAFHALTPKQKTILIFGFSWIATAAVFSIPVVASFWDATESRGFFDFATVLDGSAVNSYGLMICEQNLAHERDMITLRYLTSALPLAFFALLIAFIGIGNGEETCTPFSFFEIQSSIENDHKKNNCPQQVTAEGVYVKNSHNNNRNEHESCEDCYYAISGPIMASLLLFQFFWESVFQPLMILYCAYSDRNHYFDVGNVSIAVLMAYMPIYAYVGGRPDRINEETEENSDSEDEEINVNTSEKSPCISQSTIIV